MSDYPYDLGPYRWPVDGADAQAQEWFDRGLMWTYGFNHDEAIACFTKAAAAQPELAMAHWGVAHAAGPNYNMPWEVMDARSQAKALNRACDALERARAAPCASDLERALIAASSARTPQRLPLADMSGWDRDYADAMRALVAAHPGNLDVIALTAEALMNLTPWAMWEQQTGSPAPDAATLETQALLERAMDTLPGAMDHPGILHFYLHLMEMAPNPEKALRAADRLRTYAPDAGHLVHMPTHIDVLCGDYQSVLHWNEAAVAADLKYYAREGAFNVYTGYRQHNYHFVIYGAMFLGRMEPALAAVRGMAETTPEAMLRIPSPPMADYFEAFLAMEPHVLIRFGRWDELIAMRPPEDAVLYATLAATVHYARALAFAATGRVEEALAQEQVFETARAAVPEGRLLHNNKVRDLMGIAAEMLRGEILYRQGDYDAAFTHLRRSVLLDDTLPYDEPWGWMQPARHALGALLYEQGHIEEAEQVYREDLGLAGDLPRASIHPANVWSLRGLHDCLKSRGETVEIIHITGQLDIALARADRALAASCFCAQSAMRA